jgi:sulfite exporter TauE/SafE
MTGLSLFPIFLIGLAGSVHCVGMCGGIVGALSVTSASLRPLPVAIVARATASFSAFDSAVRVLAYNTGRIGSYALAGALAGGLAGGVRTLSGLTLLQSVGYWLANLMLVALGLYLMDVWRGLTRIEALGGAIWRHVQPLTRRVLPPDTPVKMLGAGFLWGWLPCGMVYSMLMTAMLTGSAPAGATVMMVFGLGTLPMLLALGLAGLRVRATLQRKPVRFASGMVVLAFGLLGLLRASNGLPASWLDALCITPGGVFH